MGSRLRATCLVPSRVFLDSSATGREAAGASAAGGVNTETRGTIGGDFSSALLTQKSLFQAQTVRLYPRIRPPHPHPHPRSAVSEIGTFLLRESVVSSTSSPQETGSHSCELLEGSAAQRNLPWGGSEVSPSGKIENTSFPLLLQRFWPYSNGASTPKSLKSVPFHSIRNQVVVRTLQK